MRCKRIGYAFVGSNPASPMASGARLGTHDVPGHALTARGRWLRRGDSLYVQPAEGSVWAAASRALPEVDELKQLVDLVKDDEFPLSLFYVQLRPKLEDVLERPRRESGEAVASAA
jgi:hypothetical protein